MSIGLGIFLGSVFLGLILLYISTANTWNWRKIVRRMLITLSLIVAATVLLVLAFKGYEDWTKRPQIINSIGGVELGERFSDVEFKNGVFNESKHQSSEADQGRWFTQQGGRIAVRVTNDAVSAIGYVCSSDLDYTTVNGIGCGFSGDGILGTFESLVTVLCQQEAASKAPSYRRYDVPKYGTIYHLQQNRVIGFLVVRPSEFGSLTGGSWGSCK